MKKKKLPGRPKCAITAAVY